MPEGADTVDTTVTSPPVDNPYRALVPYRSSDADVFFGRTELWRRLHVRAVPGGGPVTVLGPSGAGKSSLLDAGLIPAVERMGLRRNDTRITASTVSMTPGTTPLSTLAEGLGLDPTVVSAPASDWMAAISDRPAAQPACLLVVDQAEELFSLCDRPTRSAFLEVVDALAADERFAVVLALRADFYARAMDEPTLIRTLDDRAVVIRTMTPEELVEAIEGPARARGAAIEAGVSTAIATDLNAPESETPPLVALGVLMDRLWHNRTDSTITMASYQAAGPVTSIVAETAEQAVGQLSETDRATARLILLATLRITDHGDLVDSDVTVDHLRTALTTHRDPDRILRHLLDANLVDARPDPVTHDSRVTLIHEALAPAWPRLGGWIDERRRSATVIATLSEDADTWDADRHPDSALYDTARFRAVTDAVEDIDTLEPGAHYFLTRSRERLALRTSRRRILLATLVVVAVAATVVAITAVVRNDSDNGRRDLVTTLAQVGASAVGDPTASARLALSAYRSAPDDPRTDTALVATQAAPVARAIGAPATSEGVAASADGSRIAFAGSDGATRVVSISPTADTVATVPAPSGAGPSSEPSPSLAISADGGLVARRGADAMVELWRFDGRSATRISTIGSAAGTTVGSVALSPVRPWLAMADSGGSVRVWDISEPTRPALVTTVRGSSAGDAIAWSPQSPQLIVGSDNRQIALWDLTDPRSPRTRGPAVAAAGTVQAVTFGPDGTTAIAGDDAGNATMYDVGSGGLATRGSTVPSSSGAVESVAVSPSGKRLAVTSSDGSTQVWDITHPDTPRRSTQSLRSGSSAIAATVFTGESTLAAAGTGAPMLWSLPTGLLDGGFGGALPPACSAVRKACVTSFAAGPVQVWDVTDPTTPGSVITIDIAGHFNGATMSPDGQWMMTVDGRHLAQLWDVREIRKPVAIGPPLSLGSQSVDHMVFSPSSGLLATSTDADRMVTVSTVSMRGLIPIASITADGAKIAAIAYGADSRSIALGGDDGVVRRWTLTPDGATQIAQPLRVGPPITALAVVGPVLIVGDRSGGLTRWDPVTGRRIGPGRTVGTSAVTSITRVGSAATGLRIVTGSADGSIHRVDTDGTIVDTGNLFGPLGRGDTRVTAVTADTVLASGDTGQEQLWTIDAGTVATRTCAATGSSC